MDPETQFKEVDDYVESEVPSVIDLNRATAEELQTLAGIGPALAQHIVAYREEQGGFESPEEITAVPGIGRAAYEQLADRLTVVPPETVPTAEQALPEETPEAALPAPAIVEVEEAPPPEAEEPAPEPEEAPPEPEEEALEEALEEEPVPPAEPAPAAEEAPAPPRLEPAPAPVGQPPSRMWLYWSAAALVGALLGMAFTLAVMYGINGALDLSTSPAFVNVESDVAELASEVDTIQGQIESIETRLEPLQGVTGRVDGLEEDVTGLREEAGSLRQRADDLEKDLDVVSDRIAALEEESSHVSEFFGRLGELLQEFFGDEAAAEPTPESPVVTPTPTQ